MPLLKRDHKQGLRVLRECPRGDLEIQDPQIKQGPPPMLQQQNPPPRPSCNAAVQNTETHKAFNCDHEFLKQIIFSKYLFVYIFAVIPLKAGQTICGVHIGVAGKKFNCKSYYFVQYFVSEHNDPTSPF